MFGAVIEIYFNMNDTIYIIIQNELNEKAKEKLSKKLKNYMFEMTTPVTKINGLIIKKTGARTSIKLIKEREYSEEYYL
jgi:hypothetical protein